jgi:diguanylate cyclase (GGDEF)-like protein
MIAMYSWNYLDGAKSNQYDKAYASAQAELSTNAAALSSSINRKFALMEGLYAFISVHGVQVKHETLDSFLEQMLKHTSGITNAAISVGDTVAYTYPAAGNEKVIGYNFFEDSRSEIRADANRMLMTGNPVISGPSELLQGGLGLIERRPVYELGSYAGAVSLVINLNAVFTEAGFNHVDKSIVIAVRKPGSSVFFGDEKTFAGRNVKSQVYLPEGSWELAAKPKTEVLSAIDHNILMQKVAVTSFCVLLFMLIYLLSGSRRRLIAIVKKRTGDLDRKNQELTALLYTDTLTGISSRTYLNKRLEEVVRLSGTKGNKPGVMLLDLDHFKMVNDTFGHTAGDELLQRWVNRVREADIRYDVFARMGGDEFVFLLEDCSDRAEAEAMAGRILMTVRTPFLVSGMELHVGLSIGIAMYSGEENKGEDLLKHADTAMYRAKAKGGNSFCVFDPAMAEELMAKLRQAYEIRQALKEEEFELYYQPQVDIRTNTIVGVEALIRWNKMGQLIPPSRFIPAAEETGLIVPLSYWVLRHACLQMKRWRDAGLPPMRIAVNLSASLFRQNDLEEQIMSVLAETGLPMQLLEVEITENIAIMSEHYPFLSRLLEQGVSIAIDDFGTQYSSLSYLKSFPVSKIKIDKSFIDGIDSNRKDEAIIQAMLLVAKHLELEVVAEGVETADQVQFLTRLDCRHVQGYYCYKPMPKAQMEQIWRESAYSFK